jgi:5'-methylthioadenosine phosphorylase
MSEAISIGIIGGSGLYDMAELTDREERKVSTPFGDPSDPYIVGTLRGKRVAFLARHGVGHRYTPTELNYRANIFGMKTLGVQYILSASAVGSLQERYVPQKPRHPGPVLRSHQGAREHLLRQRAGRACRVRPSRLRTPGQGRARCVHQGRRHRPQGGTYVCMEGPAVLDAGRVEALSRVGDGHHRHDQPAGGQARARAEICYATIALVTDYDCWHPDHDSVTVEMIVQNLLANAKTAQAVIADAVSRLPYERTAECATRCSMRSSPGPRRSRIPSSAILAPIIGRYIK